MKYRRLGKTDLKVSEIGFGCQSIAGGLFYKDDGESLKALEMAFDYGINFFDTSDHYSQGESEILIGKAFKRKRDKVIIGTKAGTLYKPAADFLLKQRSLIRPVSRYLRSMKIPFHLFRAKRKHSDFSEKYLISTLEKSLKRLQTDYIDLFQLHKPSKTVIESGEIINTMEKLKAQGKIRYYGISCAQNEDAFISFNFPGISSLQLTINLLDKKYIEEIFIHALANNVGIIGRNPRAHGHLTGEFGDIMGETYARNKKEFNEKKEKARRFQFLVKPGRTIAQAALQYVLNIGGVSTVIPRAVNRRQLLENINCLKSPPISFEEMEKIDFVENQMIE
ncbi:MAG TPA: aldo/keto reductase [Ignavibacteriaceae bacterium]|nr:aldo/keto reductase [Ignavibacteriaceae bacterium]